MHAEITYSDLAATGLPRWVRWSVYNYEPGGRVEVEVVEVGMNRLVKGLPDERVSRLPSPVSRGDGFEVSDMTGEYIQLYDW